MNPWLIIVGMGEEGYEFLSPESKSALQSARIIVGSERLISKLPKLTADLHRWPQPFSKMLSQLRCFKGQLTVLLATGDPLNFGVGRKVLEEFPRSEVRVLPYLSAFSLAAARLGWSLPDCDQLTLHGRDCADLESYIQPDVRLLILTENRSTVHEVCRRLVHRGFGRSEITVLENLGGPAERVSSCLASTPPTGDISDLNTLAVHCLPDSTPIVLSRIPGLPDNAYANDGQLTKRDVRAITISALSPASGQLLWDVGSGCGSVAIEWMRCLRGCEAIAFEEEAGRVDLIRQNAAALGVPRLKIVPGRVPDTFEGQRHPHAVFLGGGVSSPGLIEECWEVLLPGGRIVANSVTLEGERRLIEVHDKLGGDMVRIDLAGLERMGEFRVMRPRMGVLQWRAAKPW